MGDPRHDNYYGTGKSSSGTTKTPNPLWADIASMIPVVGPMIGNQISRWQQQGDIARQNAYNSPLEQLARLREAGLPMSAMGGPGGAGNQSALPGTSGQGIGEGVRNIGQWAATQAQLQGIKLMNEEIRIRKAEADLKEIERNYLAAGKGIDSQGTNLTANLTSDQAYKAAQAAAQEIGNKLQTGELNNQKTKQVLENQNLAATNAKTLVEMGLTNEKIQTEELNQAMLEIQKEWTPKMNQAQWHKLLAEKGLINENTTGKQLENAITTINKRLLEETSGNILETSDIDMAMKRIMSQAQFSEFIKTSEYNTLVNKARALFSDTKKSPKEMLDGFAALLYTTITNITGGGNAAPMMGTDQKEGATIHHNYYNKN